MPRRLLPLALLALALAGPAAAQSTCRTALADADESYRSGYFDRTIDRLTGCLDADAFSPEERRQAYRLIGLSYIGKDREADARTAVRSLLEVAPDFRPDPAIDPPPFVRMVTEERRNVGVASATASGARRPASTSGGFLGALRVQGTSYTDEGGNLSGSGGDLTLGYGFSPTLSAFLKLSGSSLGDGISLGSAGIGGRFHIGGGQKKLVPFVGAAATFQTATIEESGVSADFSGAGGEVEAGLLYFLSPSFAIDGGVSALFSSLDSDLVEEPFSATTVHVGVGIAWSPGR